MEIVTIPDASRCRKANFVLPWAAGPAFWSGRF